MNEIGSELKNARESLGLTLDEIMDRTMIPKRQLKALEEERFDVFPGEVYVKGALRKYATELGLNAEELLDRYKRTRAKPATEEEEEIARQKSTVKKKRIAAPARKKRLKVGRLLGLCALVLILVFACFSVVKLLKEERFQSSPPSQNQNQQPQNEQLPQEPPEEEKPQEPEQTEPEPPPVRVERDREAEGVRFVVYHAGNIEAAMSFTGACWIRALADGKNVFEGTLQAGQTKTVTADLELSIRIGNPPAMQLVINEQPVQLPESVNPYTLTVKREP